MKARAKVKKGVTEVKLLAKHPMEPGAIAGRKKETHYITQLTGTFDGKTVFNLHSSSGISKDPYMKFYFEGAKKGDMLMLKWVDNKGKSETTEVKIK